MDISMKGLKRRYGETSNSLLHCVNPFVFSKVYLSSIILTTAILPPQSKPCPHLRLPLPARQLMVVQWKGWNPELVRWWSVEPPFGVQPSILVVPFWFTFYIIHSHLYYWFRHQERSVSHTTLTSLTQHGDPISMWRRQRHTFQRYLIPDLCPTWFRSFRRPYVPFSRFAHLIHLQTKCSNLRYRLDSLHHLWTSYQCRSLLPPRLFNTCLSIRSLRSTTQLFQLSQFLPKPLIVQSRVVLNPNVPMTKDDIRSRA